MTGATGVVGTAAVRSLVSVGHEVVALARSPQNSTVLSGQGATPVPASLGDLDSLRTLFRGCDAVCSFATHVPVGYAATWPAAWRENDRLLTEGVRRVVSAAYEAGVRRVIQASVSLLYADAGDEWITERSSLGINRATEPACVAESHVQHFQCGSRQGVVLRFGSITGNDRRTRRLLRAARQRRPVGVGDLQTWAHVVHVDDLGPAVLAALTAPTGVYNVGAEPVRRAELVRAFAVAAGQPSARLAGPLLRRLAGPRLEPLARSLRVTSQHFTDSTGWTPRRPVFDAAWLPVVAAHLATERTQPGPSRVGPGHAR